MSGETGSETSFIGDKTPDFFRELFAGLSIGLDGVLRFGFGFYRFSTIFI